MFHNNGMRPLIIACGTKCCSILYFNSQSLYIRLKFTYSAISVIVDSLPGNTKKQGIDKFVAFGVRLVHSWAGVRHAAPEASWKRSFDPCTPLEFEQHGYLGLVPEYAPGPSSQVLPGCWVRHPLGSKKGLSAVSRVNVCVCMLSISGSTM